MSEHRLDGITIELPPPWADVTAEIGEDAPWTLARPDLPGGALQLSVALHRGGRPPGLEAADLTRLARELGINNSLGPLLGEETFTAGPLTWAAASYRPRKGDDAGELWRVCYGSDGASLVMATYVCDWDRREDERADVDAIIRSVRFVGAAAADAR